MALLKKRGCAGCQPVGEPPADAGKASPDPLFFPKRHASYAGILVAFLAVTFVAGGHIDFSFLDAAKDFPGGFVWFIEQFMPNAKAFDQMGKITSALAMTILDAIAAGTLAAVIAFILAVIASRVSGVGGPVQMVIRAFATVLRNIPTVAWGFILLFSFKQAEFTGFLALFFKSLGFLTRAFIETIDEADAGSIEALKATGASRLQIIVHGVFPLSLTQVMRASRGKIKVRVRTTSGTVLAVLVAFLAVATTYTMVNMGYGSADTMQAASDLVEYFKLMFLSPYLSNYTWADMFEGLAVTLCIAVLATAGGALIALVLSLLAASNLSNKLVSNIIKTVMAVIRSVPTIIWVLVFTVAIGLGSEAAVIGMMFHTVSFLTKAFSEAFEEVDRGSLEALKATGATWWQQVARGVFPDKLNEILSWVFIRFENNFVGAVTVGAIAGSGGIGYYLYIVANYMFNWHEMGLIIYLCLAVSVTLEIIATQLRKRFIVHR